MPRMKCEYPPTNQTLKLPKRLPHEHGPIRTNDPYDYTNRLEIAWYEQLWFAMGGSEFESKGDWQSEFIPRHVRDRMMDRSRELSSDIAHLTLATPVSEIQRIVSWARQCGKSSLMLESEDDLHCHVDIENGVIDFDSTPTEPFTVNYEVNHMTPASMGAISTNEGMDERTIEKRYAALMGHKKPKYERTEADENALKAAHAKRRRKAMKRLKTAEKARETV